MHLNSITPLTPSEKATKLGLTSSRFHASSISDNARDIIEDIKKKDRSDNKLDEWAQRRLYNKDATKQLFNTPENIIRVHANQLSAEEFVDRFQRPNLPVVIQGCADSWQIEKHWNFEYFYKNFKDVKFKIGEDDDGYKLRVPLKYYFEYLIYNKDDSPLYMFESSLENNKEMLPILNNFQVPIYFRDDLLQYAGEKKRPPYRWLLMGPERSGSTVHLDPLETSAWNTSLQGHKLWVLFPENIPKFVVKGKAFRGRDYEDESINYFTQILPKMIEAEGRQRLGMITFIQKAGQTVFVPGGWWHAVLNLDDTMAVTQNIMTHTNFDKVWRSIRCERRKFAFKYLQNLKQQVISNLSQQRSLYDRALSLNKSDNYNMGNKYETQSVSLSFTGTQSSSSSSSSSSDDNSSSNTSSEDSKSKRSRSEGKKRQWSRSREKNTKKRTQSLKGRKRKLSD